MKDLTARLRSRLLRLEKRVEAPGFSVWEVILGTVDPNQLTGPAQELWLEIQAFQHDPVPPDPIEERIRLAGIRPPKPQSNSPLSQSQPKENEDDP